VTTRKKPLSKTPSRLRTSSATKARKPVVFEAIKRGDSVLPLRALSLRQRFGLSRKVFSRLSGYSERAIAEWETGKTLSDASRQRIVELERLQNGLLQIMKEDFVGEWLQTPNSAFDGLKPIEVIERGEVDRIWRMVHLVESGVPA
jgi:DNA-binding transcriptional regulator YiaG